MGTATEIRKSQSVMVVCLVLLALLCANMNRAWCFNSSIQTGDWGNSNSTATAARIEYINDDEEEFLMESEVSRRILANGNRGGIGYGGLMGGQVICSSPGRYSDCIPTYNAPSRPCGFENRCDRNV